jgi:hypothetical protein
MIGQIKLNITASVPNNIAKGITGRTNRFEIKNIVEIFPM